METRRCKWLVVAAALLLVSAAGCTDLTTEPQSTVTTTNIFNDPNSYQAFIARVYSGLAITGQQGPAGQGDIGGIDEGFSQYLRMYWEMEELPTDEAIIGWNDDAIKGLNFQTWDASVVEMNGMYSRIFFQIMMANEFLRQTTDQVLASRGVTGQLLADIKTYRAEARFLRALSYWHGLDFYGSIPLVTEQDPLGGSPPKQATRQALFDFVVSELNAIKNDLPPNGTYGRATPAAANMLLAKLYLNAEVYTGTADWTDARTAAEAVIAGPFVLEPNDELNFLADNDKSREIIFAVPQDGVHMQSYGGTSFIIHASLGGDMVASNYGVDYPWGGLRLKPQAYRLFGAGDNRADVFFTTNQSVEIDDWQNFHKGIAAPKFQNVTSTGQPGSNAGFADTDYPMFRLADAYLTYAEAVVRGGGGSRATALDYVNQIRTRAGIAPLTDAQLTTQAILDERGRELLWEGTRRTDLIRYKMFTGGTYIWSWKGGTQAGAATAATFDLYPLPANELVANHNLVQNPGY